jgi:anthranilate synthase component I
MIQPDAKTFARLARRGNLVPVCDCFRADLLTPVGAFLRLRRNRRYACLLESVEGGEKLARYTFLGVDPAEVFRYRDGLCVLETAAGRREERADPIEYLRKLLARYRPVRLPGLPPLTGGAIGYFGYEMVRLIERVPATGRDDLGLDDAVLMFHAGLVVFDHLRHRVWLVRNVFVEPGANPAAAYRAARGALRRMRRALERPLAPARRPRPRGSLRVRANMSRPRFLAAVRRAKRHIRAGDVFQVVPSLRFAVRSGGDPFEIYRALRVINPSPYLYYLELGSTTVVGSSPEMLLKVQGRDAFYRPIAGTRPRGRSEEEDRRLEAELCADAKERAEHIMLVDLGRNDLGRVSEYGSVAVEDLMFVERYSHVMHLVSRLRGRLRPEVDCLDALMACFPAGTLTGAPKVRAMEIIDELEPTRRGVYAGAILYLDFSGNLDSCIAIRTLVVKNGVAYVQAGAGIVADSVPEREYQECVNKARALLTAVAAARSSPETA